MTNKVIVDLQEGLRTVAQKTALAVRENGRQMRLQSLKSMLRDSASWPQTLAMRHLRMNVAFFSAKKSGGWLWGVVPTRHFVYLEAGMSLALKVTPKPKPRPLEPSFAYTCEFPTWIRFRPTAEQLQRWGLLFPQTQNWLVIPLAAQRYLAIGDEHWDQRSYKLLTIENDLAISLSRHDEQWEVGPLLELMAMIRDFGYESKGETITSEMNPNAIGIDDLSDILVAFEGAHQAAAAALDAPTKASNEQSLAEKLQVHFGLDQFKASTAIHVGDAGVVVEKPGDERYQLHLDLTYLTKKEDLQVQVTLKPIGFVQKGPLYDGILKLFNPVASAIEGDRKARKVLRDTFGNLQNWRDYFAAQTKPTVVFFERYGADKNRYYHLFFHGNKGDHAMTFYVRMLVEVEGTHALPEVKYVRNQAGENQNFIVLDSGAPDPARKGFKGGRIKYFLKMIAKLKAWNEVFA